MFSKVDRFIVLASASGYTYVAVRFASDVRNFKADSGMGRDDKYSSSIMSWKTNHPAVAAYSHAPLFRVILRLYHMHDVNFAVRG